MLWMADCEECLPQQYAYGTESRLCQSGVVLLLSLLIMVPLMSLGISTLESSILEEKMASNIQDRSRAFHAAEAALKAAESWLERRSVPPQASEIGEAAVWKRDDLPSAPRDGLWWHAHGIAVEIDQTLSQPPRYIIEEYSLTIQEGESVESMIGIYRIHALGVGRRATTQVRIQRVITLEYGAAVRNLD